MMPHNKELALSHNSFAVFQRLVFIYSAPIGGGHGGTGCPPQIQKIFQYVPEASQVDA